MFKSGLKIRTKLVMSAIVLCVCLAATLVGAALWILDHGVRRQADVFASTTLSTYSERIRVDLSRSIVAVRTVAAAVEALVGAGIVDRDVMGALARRLVRDNPQLVGMTLAFEPNALDGRDADFVGHAFSDAAGRFAPYFFYKGKEIEVERLVMTPEAGTESWYDRPVRENRALMTPPYPYPIDGKTVLMATVSQLVRRAGKPIAVVTGDLPLSDLSAYVQGLRPFGDGSVALIGGDDLWIANDDPALLGQPVSDPLLKSLLSDLARAPVVRRIADGHLLMATRMTLPGLDESWVLLLRVPVSTLLASLTQMRDLMLQVAAVAMLLILAAVYFGGRLLTGPISEMTQRMEQLAQDQTDIAISGLARKDEIGQMARAVEVFRRHAIARLERAEAERRESAVRLERQERLEALVGGFRGSVASVLDQAARATSDLEAVSDELRAAAESSQTHALTARGTSERASGNLHAVASAATQLTASISSISQQVALTSAIVGTASADATAADAKVTGLASAASRISEVIGLIDAIARQTNLLALNATIEAARAGASGRGFSVVAAEVKALALQTTQATQNIAAQIATIQSETQEAVEAIRAIVTIMGEVETYAGAIAEAIQSQNVATSDIGSNLESAAVGTQRVVEDIERLNAAVVGTTHSARRVRDASRSVHEVTERLDGEIDDFLREVAAA